MLTSESASQNCFFWCCCGRSVLVPIITVLFCDSLHLDHAPQEQSNAPLPLGADVVILLFSCCLTYACFSCLKSRNQFIRSHYRPRHNYIYFVFPVLCILLREATFVPGIPLQRLFGAMAVLRLCRVWVEARSCIE
eukprot:PhF_6_TR23903/c0_g1_i1/m.33472